MILSTQNINLRSNKERREKGKKRGREKGIKNKGDNYNMNKLNVSNVGKMVGKRESFMYIVKVTDLTSLLLCFLVSPNNL